MHEYKLTDEETDHIFYLAKNNFSNNLNAKHQRNFLCECVVTAFLDHCAKMNYIVKEGKIFKKHENSK